MRFHTKPHKSLEKVNEKYLLLLLCCFSLYAGEFGERSNISLGVYANTGASMGGGLELGFSLFQGSLLSLRNSISLESKASKLFNDERFDSQIFGIYDKLSLGILSGSTIASSIGFEYFRPYLYLSGGYGLLGTKENLAKTPQYWEVSAGMGHEFISHFGHTLFFELGGGVGKLTTNPTTLSQMPH
ncbi:hypothetical protein T36_0880 [Helicobacter cinaedi]|uniref:hypothetical protein n=1 Tax=Helicobacter cinaedi TaxID=213 RepID=UPI001F21C0DC|nr:hypothetical protein [Helicobacter cinaedi]BDB64428.1 hypothetical protein T36_0880 [Helicobacter cinaedi]